MLVEFSTAIVPDGGESVSQAEFEAAVQASADVPEFTIVRSETALEPPVPATLKLRIGTSRIGPGVGPVKVEPLESVQVLAPKPVAELAIP